MYAIVKTGGKQYKVAEGDVLFVEKLEGKVVTLPTRSEIDTPVAEHLIVELYSK